MNNSQRDVESALLDYYDCAKIAYCMALASPDVDRSEMYKVWKVVHDAVRDKLLDLEVSEHLMAGAWGKGLDKASKERQEHESR